MGRHAEVYQTAFDAFSTRGIFTAQFATAKREIMSIRAFPAEQAEAETPEQHGRGTLPERHETTRYERPARNGEATEVVTLHP